MWSWVGAAINVDGLEWEHGAGGAAGFPGLLGLLRRPPRTAVTVATWSWSWCTTHHRVVAPALFLKPKYPHSCCSFTASGFRNRQTAVIHAIYWNLQHLIGLFLASPGRHCFSSLSALPHRNRRMLGGRDRQPRLTGSLTSG